MSSVAAVKLWIWLSVFATCAGWTLSFFGYLRLLGYIVLGVVTLIAWRFEHPAAEPRTVLLTSRFDARASLRRVRLGTPR